MERKKDEQFISPLDFFEGDLEESKQAAPQKSGKRFSGNRKLPDGKRVAPSPQAVRPQGKAIFITATDTGVGKTIVTYVLGLLLKEQGLDVGVMKPVQCGGQDAQFLKQSLQLSDPLQAINPFFATEPLSPHMAFKVQGAAVDTERIVNIYHGLKSRHAVLLIEGAGGLLVPLTEDYTVADLVREMDAELIIVSRLGLGTINHTLLTIEQARQKGIKIKGVIFNETQKKEPGVAEKTNPDIIRHLGKVAILGTVPFLPDIKNAQDVLRQCRGVLDLRPLLEKPDTDKARELIRWDKEYLWHPFTQMKDWLEEEPLIIEEAKRCYLKSTDGRWYLDGVSSLWVNIHGHAHKHIDAAVKEQVSRLSHSTLLGLSNTPAVVLAKKLVEISPSGLEKVFYSDSGSTAVEIAIKMAYQYWQNLGETKKTKIAHLSNSYHGDTLGSVSVGGIDLFRRVYEKLMIKTVGVYFPDCYRGPKGKKYPAYAFECLKGLERILKTSGEEISALIVEPTVQAAAGMIVWPDGILKEIKALCDKYHVFLIADEVATGFGRTGKMFACEHEEVTPDFLCLAKGLTGGYLPLAATLTTKKIFEGFLFDYGNQKTFFHGHTYTGNPLACAAALANLEVFEKEQTLQNLVPKIKYLKDRLQRFYQLSHVGDVRQKGFMVGIELVRDKKNKAAYPWEEKVGMRVCQEIRKRGVILRPLGNVIVLMPPLAISIKKLGYLLDMTYWAIDKVTNAK